MSFLLSGPVLFFEQEELEILVLEFSDRLRRDKNLAPVLSRLIGNGWAEAEAATVGFLTGVLFADGQAKIDEGILDRAGNMLHTKDVERIMDVLLESALKCLPLQSAALVSGVGDDLGAILKAIIELDSPARRDMLLEAYAKLSAGALGSSI
jgi:hypothetical protein